MGRFWRIFGLRSNVFFLGLVSLFNDFSNEMIQSVMPVYLTVVLGAPPFVVGLIEGAADSLASFLKIFSGWLSDRIGKRKGPAMLGYALSVSTRPFFALASNISQVFGLRLADRVGKGFRDAPRDALLSESADHKELGRSFGYHRAMDAVGGTLGPIAAFFLLPFLGFNYRSLFLVAFGVGVLSILSFVFVKEIRKPEALGRIRLSLRLFKEHRRFSWFIGAVFVFGLGTLPITLMLLKPIETGLQAGNVPLVYFIYSIVFVLGAMPLGRLSDKIGESRVIILGFGFAIACYLVLASTVSAAISVLAFVLFGLYSAATDGVERALAAKLIGSELLATGQGLLNAAVGVSSLLAGIFGGILWTAFGSQAAFIYGALVSILGLAVFVDVFYLRK